MRAQPRQGMALVVTLIMLDSYGRQVGRSVGYPGSLERLAGIVGRHFHE